LNKNYYKLYIIEINSYLSGSVAGIITGYTFGYFLKYFNQLKIALVASILGIFSFS